MKNNTSTYKNCIVSLNQPTYIRTSLRHLKVNSYCCIEFKEKQLIFLLNKISLKYIFHFSVRGSADV